MSTREKNLLMYFLGVSKSDNGCTKQYEKVLTELTKLAYRLGIKDGTPQNREFMALENEIVELFQMTKDTYFNFGENAKEVVEEYNLEDVA